MSDHEQHIHHWLDDLRSWFAERAVSEYGEADRDAGGEDDNSGDHALSPEG